MLVLLAAAWVTLAPAEVGGRAAYVIVNGNSMEPEYHRGDLVIVHATEDYQNGDVVAYRHPSIGPVIHRIVNRDGDQFVFQGDNNSWLDSYQPVQSEFIGETWVHVPYAGKVIEWLHAPKGMAALAGLVGIIAMTTFKSTNNQRKRPQDGQASANNDPPGSARPAGNIGDGMVTLLAAVMLASILLGFFAFSRPVSQEVSNDVAYEHKGSFNYTAIVPSGVYDTYKVRTGEPVFRKLTETVDVQFDYQLTSNLPTDEVEGTYRLVAEISDPNGWKRTFPLQKDKSFSGGEFKAKGVLNLYKVQQLINNLEQRTDFRANRYAVAIIPEVTVEGMLAGQELDDGFSPKLQFWFDPIQLQLQNQADGNTDPQQLSEGSDPLKPSEQGSVQQTRTAPNTLPILILDLNVSTARVLSLLGFALSLGGLLWIGLPMWNAYRGHESARIRSRYGPLLISVSGDDLAFDGRVVELAAFEDLAKIAEKGGQSILHHANGNFDDYYVHNAEVTYHYRTVVQEPDGSPLTTGG